MLPKEHHKAEDAALAMDFVEGMRAAQQQPPPSNAIPPPSPPRGDSSRCLRLPSVLSMDYVEGMRAAQQQPPPSHDIPPPPPAPLPVGTRPGCLRLPSVPSVSRRPDASSVGVVVIGGGGVDLEPVGVEPLDLLCELQGLLLPHALVGKPPSLELWLRGPWMMQGVGGGTEGEEEGSHPWVRQRIRSSRGSEWTGVPKAASSCPRKP